MADIRKLITQIAAEEARAVEALFVAPCARGGRVRARVAGLVRTYRPTPRSFEGWGLFRPVDARTAEVVEEADLPTVARYLELLTPLRMLLARPLSGATWLAYPANEGDARQRLGEARPAPIHLVSDGALFEPVIARWDGAAWWFAETDRRADPQSAEKMREALKQAIPPEAMRLPGLTPEMRAVYDMAAQVTAAFAALRQRRTDEARLRDALGRAGGDLRDFRERGDFWQVEWTARDGTRHTSAISRRDLTVLSSGICLSGRDRDFDLQSLVGVMDGQG